MRRHPTTTTTTTDPAETTDRATSRRAFLGLAGVAGTLQAARGAGLVGPTSGGATISAASTAAAVAELGYAETVTPISTTGTVLLPNLSLRVPLGDGPVAVEYGGYVSSSAANGLVKLYLLRDGTAVHEVGCTIAGAGGVGYLRGQARLAPTQVVTSTFTVLLANWTAKATVQALGMALSPAFVQARRL